MKKDLATHFVFFVALFILFSVYRDWLDLSFVPFWLGGIIGILLPYVDYLIYIYLLKPGELASQEVTSLISKKQLSNSWDVAMDKFSDRKGLLIHNATFQVLFLVFTIWIVTSGSLIGMGLVLAFILHLILDQVTELMEKGNINSWFNNFPVNLDAEQKHWFLIANILVFLFLGFFF